MPGALLLTEGAAPLLGHKIGEVHTTVMHFLYYILTGGHCKATYYQ